MKKYQNIVSNKPYYTTYIIIKDYDTLEEATKNLHDDFEKWKKNFIEKNGEKVYKYLFPFYWATIKDNEI